MKGYQLEIFLVQFRYEICAHMSAAWDYITVTLSRVWKQRERKGQTDRVTDWLADVVAE